jgi:hypothetical protein
MSWSDDRTKASGVPLSVRKENLRHVNLVLQKLAGDEDLHDDLKTSEVQRAIQHWTGSKRLPPEDAVKLQHHRRVVYVLQRMQMFQMIFKQAGITHVPLNLLLEGKSAVPTDVALQLFGADIFDEKTENEKMTASTSTPSLTTNRTSNKSKTASNNSADHTEFKSNNASEFSQGASEEDLKRVKEESERARAAAEDEYEVQRKEADNIKNSPAPESDAGILTILTFGVTLLAILVYFFMSQGESVANDATTDSA